MELTIDESKKVQIGNVFNYYDRNKRVDVDECYLFVDDQIAISKVYNLIELYIDLFPTSVLRSYS